MDMFEALRKVKNGSISSTRLLESDELEGIFFLLDEELATGTKTGKGYVNLKLTQKGEEFLKTGEMPLSSLSMKIPWYQKPLGILLIAVVGGLIVAYLTHAFGWQGGNS